MFDFNHTQPNPPPINPKVNLAKLDLFSNSNQNITDSNYNINPKQILDPKKSFGPRKCLTLPPK